MQQTQLNTNYLPNKYINGMHFFWGGNTTLMVGPGQCRDSANAMDISTDDTLSVDITKSGVNGLDQGTVANNTWYAVYVIASSTNHAQPAVIASTSATSPVMPENYDSARRVGWALTNGSAQFLGFSVHGGSVARKFFWDHLITEYSGNSSASFTDLDMKSSIPPTSSVVYINWAFIPASAGNSIYLRKKGSTAVSNQCVALSGASTSSVIIFNTDANQVMQYMSSSASDVVSFYTYGYEDFLD